MLEDFSVLWMKTVFHLLDGWQCFIWWSNGATNNSVLDVLEVLSGIFMSRRLLAFSPPFLCQRHRPPCPAHSHPRWNFIKMTVLSSRCFEDHASVGGCLKWHSVGWQAARTTRSHSCCSTLWGLCKSIVTHTVCHKRFSLLPTQPSKEVGEIEFLCGEK